MLHNLRAKVYGVLTGERLNGFAPFRMAKSAVLLANDVVGRPLASEEEFAERVAFEVSRASAAKEKALSQAPIVVFHIDRMPIEMKKITDMLDGEKLNYVVRPIADDEAAISAAKMDSDNARFPMLFIAGDFIGGVEALTNLIGQQKLKRLVYPES